MRKTLYAILGLEPTATDENIHSAYERLRAQTDPTDNLRMLALREAWATLIDPARRARYDKTLESVVPDQNIMIYDNLTPRTIWLPSIVLGCAVLVACWFALHRGQATGIELPPTAAGPAATQNQGGVVTGAIGTPLLSAPAVSVQEPAEKPVEQTPATEAAQSAAH
jgi:curved DNA-binding protein CbpA